jgi:hypothetical protein
MFREMIMSIRSKTLGALVAGVILATQAQAATTVLDETVTVARFGNLATSSVFSFGLPGQTFDLTVKASSAGSSWLLLSMFPVIAPTRVLALEPIEPTSIVSLAAPLGSVAEIYTYTGLAAGSYSFDAYGAASSTIRIEAMANVTAVPEAGALISAAFGGLVAVAAVKRRRQQSANA